MELLGRAPQNGRENEIGEHEWVGADKHLWRVNKTAHCPPLKIYLHEVKMRFCLPHTPLHLLI